MLGQRARSVLFENFISDLIRCHHGLAKTCSLSNQGECPPCPRPAQLSAPTLSSNTRSTSPWCQSYCCPQYSWVYRVPFKSREEWDLYLFILLFLSSVECRCLDRETYYNFTQKILGVIVYMFHIGMLLLAELYAA